MLREIGVKRKINLLEKAFGPALLLLIVTPCSSSTQSTPSPMPLKDVKTWMYQFQDLESKRAIRTLASSGYDLLVVEPTATYSKGKGFDAKGMVDLFCDAHELPFLDETFDGVIASAVLEHVVYPERVAAEIHRVLARRGLIYSEIPFLQQVHEGAYDFTRYTLSGHRRLLNHFEEFSSGVVAGPGTTLAWAIEHFAVCCTPRRNG